MGFLAGDYTPHPNSLLFNAFPGFWPFKLYWFFRKVSPLAKSLASFNLTGCDRDRPERSSCCKTSLRHPRDTPTTRDLVATSHFPSSTERKAITPCAATTSETQQPFKA